MGIKLIQEIIWKLILFSCAYYIACTTPENFALSLPINTTIELNWDLFSPFLLLILGTCSLCYVVLIFCCVIPYFLNGI